MKIIYDLYRQLPLSAEQRQRISHVRSELRKMLPYSFQQPNPALRGCGTVQDIYPWISRDRFNTRFFIQNFYSVYYPKLNTNTEVELWYYDRNGNEILHQRKKLRHLETIEISVKDEIERAGIEESQGTLMWHIILPADILSRPECKKGHAYFTDRSYFAFVKDDVQYAFVHGIDRYAVFQKTEAKKFDYFYTEDKNYTWVPEIPIGTSTGAERIDVLTMNRTLADSNLVLEVFDSKHAKLKEFKQKVLHRGVFFESLTSDDLKKMGGEGSLRMSGLTTPWSRLLIILTYPNGAISAMHC